MGYDHEIEKPRTDDLLGAIVGTLDRMDLRQRSFEDEVRREFGELRSEFSGLKGEVSDLKSDVSTLKSDVSVLKSDVAELKTDVRRLDAKVDDIAETLTETVQDHEVRLVALEAKA